MKIGFPKTLTFLGIILMQIVTKIIINKMKRVYFILTILSISIHLYAQDDYELMNNGNFDAYEGTWAYQSNDTVFKIFLQTEQTYYVPLHKKSKGIFGSYYLSVGNKVLDDYRGDLPSKMVLDRGKIKWPDNLCIKGTNMTHHDSLIPPPYIGIVFFDKRKRHFNGKGISGGYIELLSPDTIRLHFDEKFGIWMETEGTDLIVEPIGFSVPNNVILVKEK